MADNESTTATTEITAPRVSWDAFYVGPEGFGEHFQVVATDSRPIIEGRGKLLNWLTTIGAKPQPRDIAFPNKAAAMARPAPQPDPMMRAAEQVLGASVIKTCSIHNVAMKRIPSSAESGKLSQYGKSYSAFWICEAERGCRG